MPKSEQKKRVKELTIDMQNKPSKPTCIASSSTTPTTHIARPASPIKQEHLYPKLTKEVLSKPVPSSVPSQTLAHVPAQQQAACTHEVSATAQTTTNPKPLPMLPTLLPPVMSTIPYCMPVCGTDCAPKFNGKPAQLHDFLKTYDQHTDDANLQGLDRITQLLELWSGLPQAKLSDYNAFIKEVKEMYPGWEGDHHYTVTDLQAVAVKYSKLPMTWRDELSEYIRAFRKVMQALMNKGTVGSSERDRIFLEGLPSQIQQQTRMHLLIKFPDHHPQDPYPFADVNMAALFLLPESPPPPQSASTPVNTQLASLLPKAVQTPLQGAVTKREYSHPSPAAMDMSCIFCGGNDHFIGQCQERTKYMEAVKFISLGSEHTLKEKIDHFNKENPPLQSIQAGLFYRASPEVDCILKIDPSAFIHTVVDSESELDKDECALENTKQALAFVKAKVDQKRSAKDKVKSVCFDGIDVPNSAHPGPASRQATVEEELISPEVRTSSSKGKNLEVAKIITPAADAPIVGTKSSSSSSVSKPTNTPPPVASTPMPTPSGAYRLSCPLEDKGAEKCITDQILDIMLPVPIRDILAVSPDIRKSMHNLSSNKRVTIGTVSYEDARMRIDDGHIVADHFCYELGWVSCRWFKREPSFAKDVFDKRFLLQTSRGSGLTLVLRV
ncbi:hypothetical protein EDD22DRAFT_1015293 [Suillus occidentalis]|nr:hypothetical protein EDD22DRAFT_1015293 [Suillus occidentalis]